MVFMIVYKSEGNQSNYYLNQNKFQRELGKKWIHEWESFKS